MAQPFMEQLRFPRSDAQPGDPVIALFPAIGTTLHLHDVVEETNGVALFCLHQIAEDPSGQIFHIMWVCRVHSAFQFQPSPMWISSLVTAEMYRRPPTGTEELSTSDFEEDID